MRKGSRPLGERLRCPCGESGAVPTKKTCCLRMKSSRSLPNSSYNLPIAISLMIRRHGDTAVESGRGELRRHPVPRYNDVMGNKRPDPRGRGSQSTPPNRFGGPVHVLDLEEVEHDEG